MLNNRLCFKKKCPYTRCQAQTYVDKNQHLPEIPSAAEVEKNGQDLGEMNKLLLKKLEEMTLYMIEKDKEIKDLQKQVAEIKNNKK